MSIVEGVLRIFDGIVKILDILQFIPAGRKRRRRPKPVEKRSA